MKVTPFQTGTSLIVIHGQIWGPRGDRDLTLVLDTGASTTLITPEVLDEIGYSPRHGESSTTITSAIGDEAGYLLRVSRFGALGYEFEKFRLHVHDLPESHGIDGLLGLDFLNRFNYEIRSLEGQILVEPAAPLDA